MEGLKVKAKAFTAAGMSAVGTTVFAAVSDGRIDVSELAAIIAVVGATFGLTWLVPNTPAPTPVGRP